MRKSFVTLHGQNQESNGYDSVYNATGMKQFGAHMVLAAVTEKIVKDAEAEQTHRALIVKRLTIAEYVLYPLGLAVALVGKLFAGSEGPDLD